MGRVRLVWCLLGALVVFGGGQTAAQAGACLTKTCACDDDCSGLVCNADGRCCAPPVTGTPCPKKDAGADSGSAGKGGSDAGTPPTSSGGGCRLVEARGASSGAAIAVSFLLVAARRRTKCKR